MATRQNTDYGYDIQKVYLEMLLSDAVTFVRCQNIFDDSLFDRRLQPAAKFINDYVSQYTIMPKVDMVNSAASTDLREINDLEESHYDWLMDEFETFTRHKSLERAIMESADLLENGNYGPVEDKIKQAVQIGLQKDMGTDYFADPRGRLLGIKDKNGQISTGWPALDRRLFGGMNRGELNIFAGASGAGKSLFLANLGVNWAQTGLNVLYLTLELSEALVGMRIDSMVTDIPSRDIFKNIDDVELKVKMIGKKSGSLQIKYMPSGKTANDVRAYIKELEIQSGKRFDVILLDYLDLLMPVSVKVSPENLFIKDKYVSEELRNLAMELNMIFVTASQLNRGAVEEIEFDHSHISGGLSKIQTADNVFGIFTSRAMRERGKYQLQLMKTRSSSGVGSKVDLDFNVDTLRIFDSGEDEDDDQGNAPTGSAASKIGSAIINKVKRQGAAADADDAGDPAPTDGGPVPKVRGETNSTLLRNFLNNLEDED